MAEVSWLLAALDDLDEIVRFVQKGSDTYPAVVASKLRDAARELARFPTIGRIIPERNDPNLRHRIVYSYRLIYHVHAERITVIAILHGARDITNVLNDRLPDARP